MENPLDVPLPKVRFNGFKMSVNAGDITMNLTLDGHEVAVLHASPTVAKSFGQVIDKAVGGSSDENAERRPIGYFDDAYEIADVERMELEETMGRVDQTPER